MKKLNKKYTSVSLLLAAGLIASTASAAVVACSTGISLEKIQQRKRDTSTLTQLTSSNVESWNPAWTMNQADWQFLADMYATSLAVDEYGRTYGDVFESGYAAAGQSEPSPYVGNPAEGFDASVWNYKIRENANWFDAEGNILRRINAADYHRTAKYILNANNASQVDLLWKSFVKNAKEVSTLMTAYISHPTENGLTTTGDTLINDAYAKAITNVKTVGEVKYFDIVSKEQTTPSEQTLKVEQAGYGLVTPGYDPTLPVSETNKEESYEVTFELTKPSTYFETVLTYGPFTPIHESINSQLENGPANAYSGAYLPVETNSAGNVKLKKNGKYHFADVTSIENIVWNYVSKVNSSTSREAFETGETDGFTVNSTDSAGWDKYVGADAQSPVFTGAYNTEPTEDFSFMTAFNFYNTGIDIYEKDSEDQKIAVAGSKILQSDSARRLIATGLNRSIFAKYYSDKFDAEGAEVSKNVRNVYTSPNFAINQDNQKDYTDYVKEYAASQTVSTDDTAASFDEGVDPLLNQSENFKMGDGSVKDTEALIADVNAFIKEYNVYTGDDNRVDLTININPDTPSTNVYLLSMIEDFNSIPNNPLFIKTVDAISNEDWYAKNNSGNFHLIQSGWGPDYADPYTYLQTFTTSGDYRPYSGSARLAGTESTKNLDLLKGEGTNGDEAYQDTVNTFKSYTDSTHAIDINSAYSTDQRYTAFAEQEYNLIYRDNLMVTMYNRNPEKSYKVSYIAPYTYGHAIYGVSQQKSFTLEKNPGIYDKEIYDSLIDLYKVTIQAIDKDITFRKSDMEFYSK